MPSLSMEHELILTFVILIVMGLALWVTGGAPIPEPIAKWALGAIVVVIAAVAILRVWGLAF